MMIGKEHLLKQESNIKSLQFNTNLMLFKMRKSVVAK